MKDVKAPNTLSHILIAFFLFLLILVLFTVYILDGAPLTKKVVLSGGEVNLSRSLSGGDNHVYLLEGEWEFYPNALYTHEDFENGSFSPGETVSYPDYWKNHIPAVTTGYGTYRAQIQIPDGFSDMGVYARYQFSASEVFIDGIKVCGNGRVSSATESYIPNYAPSTGYLIEYSPGDNVVNVIIHVENYTHTSAGLTNGIYFGSARAVRSLHVLLLFFNAFLSGGLFMMVIHFFLVYSHSRHKREYIDYSIVSVFSLFISLTTGGEALVYQLVGHLTWFDPIMILRFEYCSLIAGSFFANYQYIKAFFKSRGMRMTIVYTIVAALILGEMIIPTMTLTKLSVVNAVFAAVIFIIPFISNLRSYALGRDANSLISTASYLLIFGGLITYFTGMFPWGSVDLFSWSLLIHCAIQMLIFLRRHGQTEDDLLTLTQTLETRIEERTAELRETKEKAVAATDAKSEFLATMSHEIRTPLNAIIGMSSLISTDNMDGIQQRYFNDIQRTSKSLLQIINDVLDFSKIEAGKLEITPGHFNIYQLYDNLASITAFSAEAKGLAFSSDFDGNIPDTMYADEVRYRQIVMNILNNAVKYTMEGSVYFKVSLADDMVCFEVRDTGIGIKEEDKDRVFGSFEQLDRKRNQKIVGTGLGLSITKRLTDMLGGRIEFDSVYELGTVFYIYLPFVKGDASKVDKVEDLSVIVASDEANVLVVDDNSINLTVALGFLAKHNIIADTAQSGETALEMVQHKQYDIIFMDHMMPGMDGVETTHAIRRLGEAGDLWLMQVPIIALTANAVSGAKEMLLSEGLNDFLSKPISAAHLNAILSRWLPKEKLSYSKPLTEEASTLSDSHQDLLMELETIEDLHIYDALDNMDYNTAVYFDLLRQFSAEAEDYCSEITRHRESRDWKNYTIKVHAMKGILANMGAKSGAEFAYELELAGREENETVINQQTEILIGMVKTLKDKIAAINLTAAPPSERQKVNSEELIARLEAFIPAVTYWDSNTADDTAAWLTGITFSEELDGIFSEIVDAVRSIDYDIAAEKTQLCLELLRRYTAYTA